jgi:hypothetical protein
MSKFLQDIIASNPHINIHQNYGFVQIIDHHFNVLELRIQQLERYIKRMEGGSNRTMTYEEFQRVFGLEEEELTKYIQKVGAPPRIDKEGALPTEEKTEAHPAQQSSFVLKI